MNERIVVYYDSMTGNVERFIKKISRYSDFEFIKIKPDTVVEKFSHFITFTTGIGQVHKNTVRFLANMENFKKIKTVSVSGNMNWGPYFGLAGDKISKKYNIPLIMKFELSGTYEEAQEYVKRILEFERGVDN